MCFGKFLSKMSVCVIDECTHDCLVICGMCCALSILEIMYIMSSWYMVPSFLGSLRLCLNCSSMHLK